MKKILMITAAAILGFGISFAAVWFTRSNQPVIPEKVESAKDSANIVSSLEEQRPREVTPVAEATKSLPEKRLQNLIEDIRNRISDYKTREQQLDDYQQQLEMTKETLSQDVERLTGIYEQLSREILNLKKQQKMLKDKVVEIKKDQSQRLQQLAAVYNKMDETASSKIFVNMISNNQINDAAKIIFFMSDKKAASVLAEITNREPALARALCTKIKYLKEEL